VHRSKERFIKIGRAADNDIAINSKTISSYHCTIRLINNRYFIEDLGSTNGTNVNGERIKKTVEISKNDSILLANNTELRWGSIEHAFKNKSIKTEQFQKEIVRIGRAADNDVVINNIKVSRYHVEIRKENQHFIIKDLDSSNGTFLNNKRISNAEASTEDIISVGGFEIKLKELFAEGYESIESKIQLSVRNVSFRVNEKVLVQPMDLCINGGEFVGLIGPSGAGKTTLMLLLAGINPCNSGTVNINSMSLHHNSEVFQGQIGYVPQEDIIHRELTVKESLEYTCRLRLGKHLSDNERDEHIQNILNSLQLSEAQDVLIGSPEKKGISGGQRKRVNMAQELITEPYIFFLDEPTSGLDPQSDSDVMDMLQDIASKGKMVVITTHNITQRNFEKLSHLIVMAKNGYLAYYGPAREATAYFGVKQPEEIFKRLEEDSSINWAEKYLKSKYFQTEVERKIKAELNASDYQSTKTKLAKGGADQWLVLVQRMFKIKVRDRTSTTIMLLQAPIITLFSYIAFYDNETNVVPMLFVLVIASIWLGCNNSSREIVSERSIFKRERMVNLSVWNYLSSKIVVLSILSLLQSMILALTPYFADFKIGFSYLSLSFIFFVVSITAMSMGFLISSIVKTNESAMALVPVVLIPQVIFGGLIVYYQAMNSLSQSISSLMLSRWGFDWATYNSGHFRSILGFDTELASIIFVHLLFIVCFTGVTLRLLRRK